MTDYTGNVVGVATTATGGPLGTAPAIWDRISSFLFKKEESFPTNISILGSSAGATFLDATETTIDNTNVSSNSGNFVVSYQFSPSSTGAIDQEVFFCVNGLDNGAVAANESFFNGNPNLPVGTTYRRYVVHRFSSTAPTGGVPFSFANNTDNHTIHVRGRNGYTRANSPGGWINDLGINEFAMVIGRTFTGGGVSALMKEKLPAFNNDTTTRNAVLMLGGSDSPNINAGGGRAGGLTGQNGGPCRNNGGSSCCNGNGGGGGTQNSAGGGAGGGAQGGPGNGFAGGGGGGGSGADGWYGGGGGSRDTGQCPGSGVGGAGSSHIDPAIPGPNSLNTNWATSPDAGNYWYLNAPYWTNNRICGGKF